MDVAFVVLVVAIFALLALVVKGLEKLHHSSTPPQLHHSSRPPQL